ncbi:MAG: NAD(P)/FAD-dependent oxidoreductase, partial [Bacteroidales bacterium]
MQKTLNLSLLPDEAATHERLRETVAPLISVDAGSILHLRIDRKSIDARSRQVKVNLTVTVFVDELPKGHEITAFMYNPVPSGAPEVVIVGAGPAGLFAALRCIELGIKPLLLERGKAVAERKRDIAQLCRNQGLDPESNYCFGEGGAGTFSDGKLYTRSRKRGDARRIFDNFFYHGAPESILYESHPHIGTDNLPDVIRKMRTTILDCGGEVHFQTRVAGLCLENGCVVGVTTATGSTFRAKAVILATGHSARDMYEELHN